MLPARRTRCPGAVGPTKSRPYGRPARGSRSPRRIPACSRIRPEMRVPFSGQREDGDRAGRAGSSGPLASASARGCSRSPVVTADNQGDALARVRLEGGDGREHVGGEAVVDELTPATMPIGRRRLFSPSKPSAARAIASPSPASGTPRASRQARAMTAFRRLWAPGSPRCSSQRPGGRGRRRAGRGGGAGQRSPTGTCTVETGAVETGAVEIGAVETGVLTATQRTPGPSPTRARKSGLSPSATVSSAPGCCRRRACPGSTPPLRHASRGDQDGARSLPRPASNRPNRLPGSSRPR